MNVRYRVELSQAERDELTAMLGGGKHAARKLKRAQILLAADGGRRDEEIVRTVTNTIGMVVVADFRATAGCAPAATTRSGLRAVNSAAKAG
jgi:hypothetical protein